MKKLYIIGNGFDRHHSLDTRYQTFAFFLQDNYSEIYEHLIQYYYLPDLDRNIASDFNDPKWAEFESALAELDAESLLSDNTDYLPNISSDDFRDRDWHTYQQVLGGIVTNLTDNLFKAFKEFILQVRFPTNIDEYRLCLSGTAQYLTFNYTDTLERYYKISENRILYIHHKATDKSSTLILGHGVEPDIFRQEPAKPPEGASEEELERWMEYMSDNYDYSYESGKEEVLHYYARSFKHTINVIQENAAFFDKIKDVSHVVILGHSLTPIDMPYFQAIFNSVRLGAAWSASFYSDYEQEHHRQALTELGVSHNRIRLFKMTQLTKTSWNCLIECATDIISRFTSKKQNK
jgi:hypothetical protein